MSRRPHVENATVQDGAQMLALMEAEPAKGPLSLIYTRRPNPVLSYRTESSRSVVQVIRDKQGRIAYQGAVVVRDNCLDLAPASIGYVTGVRKRPDYRGIVNWIRLCADGLEQYGCDGFLFSFLAENARAEKMITKRRSYLPPVYPVCNYTTFLIHPKAVVRKRYHVPRNVFLSCVTDMGAAVSFLQREGFRHDFFPYIRSPEAECPGLKQGDCFVLTRGGEIVGFCALWNQSSYKQIVVNAYRGCYRLIRPFPRITELLGYIPLPKEKEVLSFPYLSLFLVRDDDVALARAMLFLAAKEALSRGERMLVCGAADTGSFKQQVLDPVRSLHFGSRLYYMPRDAEADPVFRNPQPECAWL